MDVAVMYRAAGSLELARSAEARLGLGGARGRPGERVGKGRPSARGCDAAPTLRKSRLKMKFQSENLLMTRRAGVFISAQNFERTRDCSRCGMTFMTLRLRRKAARVNSRDFKESALLALLLLAALASSHVANGEWSGRRRRARRGTDKTDD